MARQKCFPFTAILGQERMKEALILNLIDPSLGGVLIRGQKGTAKTTAVRALADVVQDLKVVELPMNATEDRVAGTIDVEYALKTGKKKFAPGILAEADGQILYVDEMNLLEDHLVDLLLDAAATGCNTVEREGISYTHNARFTLVGTMNPEEGNLRPQLLDRFAMVVDVAGEKDAHLRAEIIGRRLAFERNPVGFSRKYSALQKALAEQIENARALLPKVKIPEDMLLFAAEIGIAFETEGHRADISMVKTAKALAALRGKKKVGEEEIRRAAEYTLPHRMRKNPMDTGRMDVATIEQKITEVWQSRQETVRKEVGAAEKKTVAEEKWLAEKKTAAEKKCTAGKKSAREGKNVEGNEDGSRSDAEDG